MHLHIGGNDHECRLMTHDGPAERGRAMGVSGAVVGIGLSAGPLAGGLLVDTLGWQSLFYSRAPLGLLGAALAWWILPASIITAFGVATAR